MAFYIEYPDGHATLVISWSRHNARTYREAEQEARALIASAVETDGVSKHPPLRWRREESQREHLRWYLAVFGDSEKDLKERSSALAKRYRSLRYKPWSWTERRRVKTAYMRLDGMMTVAYGLTITWR